MPYIELAELQGTKVLIAPLYRFFQSGQVLTWIEVMATVKQLQVVPEFAKSLRRWVERARKAELTPDLIEMMDVIQSWTKDLEYIVMEYHSCLKQYPNEVYYIQPTFLPKRSLLRSQLETLTSCRNEPPARSFSERTEWEPFKFLSLPLPITSNPDFISLNMSRFIFNPKGSLLAFRGAHQVIVLSAYTGVVVGAFQFPKREVACVAFGTRSSTIVISFTSSESLLLDLRSGALIQEPSSPSTSNGNGVKRNDSAPLGTGDMTLRRGEKSSELGLGREEMNLAMSYLEERTSAVGPEGVRAILTKDGILKVSDEMENTLFFRKIKVDIETSKPALKSSLTGFKVDTSGKLRKQEMESESISISKISLVTEKTYTNETVITDGMVQYKCYDIGTHMMEDLVINKILEQSERGGHKRYSHSVRS